MGAVYGDRKINQIYTNFKIKHDTDLCHQQPWPPDPCLELYLLPPDQV